MSAGRPPRMGACVASLHACNSIVVACNSITCISSTTSCCAVAHAPCRGMHGLAFLSQAPLSGLGLRRYRRCRHGLSFALARLF